MIIKATSICPANVDISSRERLSDKNPVERLPFRISIRHGQTIDVDDKYYTLENLQNALKLGYIEILDYDKQNVFIQEIKVAESHTTNLNLTKVEILNRSDYPQDAFEKFNANMDLLDSTISTLSNNIDGGFANSTYLVSQSIDGGGASG